MTIDEISIPNTTITLGIFKKPSGPDLSVDWKFPTQSLPSQVDASTAARSLPEMEGTPAFSETIAGGFGCNRANTT